MAKVWFETKTIKQGLKLAKEISRLKDFDDHSVMIETPKKIIAYCDTNEPMTKKQIEKIDKERFN